MEIKKVIELHELAKADGANYPKQRLLLKCLQEEKGRHYIGIVGPRGVGKTILLRQLAVAQRNAFYLSMDTLDRDIDCFDLITQLHERFHYTTFLLDEVHYHKDPNALLKQLYDFHSIRVIFTSSVALAMHASASDLSRRVRLFPLHVFTYREYLEFAHNVILSKLDLATLCECSWSSEHARAGYRFDQYLRGGMLPFATQEPEPLPLLANILEKIITRDIPTIQRVTTDELELVAKLVKFVGRSAVDGINYSSLSRNLGITKFKAAQYINHLEAAFVVRQIFPAGTNVLREPKILMTPPYRLLFREYEDAIGGLREDIAAEFLTQAGISLKYLKSTRGAKTPDYLIDLDGKRIVIEVGGPGKGREQFKGICADKKIILAHSDIPVPGSIPLFMAGFLG